MDVLPEVILQQIVDALSVGTEVRRCREVARCWCTVVNATVNTLRTIRFSNLTHIDVQSVVNAELCTFLEQACTKLKTV